MKAVQKAAAADAFIELIAERVAERVLERIGSTAGSGDMRLLSLKQAGAIIGRSAGAVAQLIQRGELIGVRCGRRVHIEQKEIQGWIERCRDAH